MCVCVCVCMCVCMCVCVWVCVESVGWQGLVWVYAQVCGWVAGCVGECGSEWVGRRVRGTHTYTHTNTRTHKNNHTNISTHASAQTYKFTRKAEQWNQCRLVMVADMASRGSSRAFRPRSVATMPLAGLALLQESRKGATLQTCFAHLREIVSPIMRAAARSPRRLALTG